MSEIKNKKGRSEREEESLLTLYTDSSIGYTTEDRFYKNLKRKGFSFSKKEVHEFMNSIPVKEIHTEKRRLFKHIQVNDIRDQYQMDLIVVVARKKTHQSDALLHYIMVLIDVYSRKGDCRYIYNKKAESCLKALKEMIKTMGKPKVILSDEGNEWKASLIKWCGDEGIELSLRSGDAKYAVGIAERFNRTLLGYIKRYKTMHNGRMTSSAFEVNLPKFIDNYNNAYHRTIGCTPNEAFESNMVEVQHDNRRIQDTYFKIGDHVRVLRGTDIFSKKGREERYSRKVFTIVAADKNRYTLDEPFEGRKDFSYNMLLLSNHNTTEKQDTIAPNDHESKEQANKKKTNKEHRVPDHLDDEKVFNIDDLSEEELNYLKKKYRFLPKTERGIVIYNKIWGNTLKDGKRKRNAAKLSSLL